MSCGKVAAWGCGGIASLIVLLIAVPFAWREFSDIHEHAQGRPTRKEKTEAERTQRLEELVAQKRIAIGMTTDQVERSWGKPTRRNIKQYQNIRREQWVWENTKRQSDRYVYFENGVMTTYEIRN